METTEMRSCSSAVMHLTPELEVPSSNLRGVLQLEHTVFRARESVTPRAGKDAARDKRLLYAGAWRSPRYLTFTFTYGDHRAAKHRHGVGAPPSDQTKAPDVPLGPEC